VWRGAQWESFKGVWCGRRIEASAMLAGVCGCVVMAVWYDWLEGSTSRFVVLPFVMWAALRFGTRGVTVVNLAVALLVGWFTLRGFGGEMPRLDTTHERNIELQLGLGLVAFFGLIPAIVIAAHRRTEAELRTQRNLHQAIFDSGPECVKVFGLDGALVQMNRAGLAIFEVESSGEAQAFGVMNFIQPDYHERFLALHRLGAGGGSGALLFQLRGKRGALRWLDMHATALRDGDGKVTGVLGVTRDVTDRKQAEEALRLARFTVDRATLAMLWITRDAAIADANEAACQLLGYPRDELLRLRVRDIEADGVEADWRARWEDLKRAESRTSFGQQRKKDGGLIDVVVSTHFLRFADRELSCAFVRDVTEQKRAQDALRKSEEQLNLIFSAVADGVVVQDQNLRIIQCNAAAERILGLSTEQMAGLTSLEPRGRTVHEDGRPFPGETHPSAVALRTALPVRDVVMGVHKSDGSLAWISVNAEPLRDAQGGVQMVVSSFSDITTSRALQEQVRQAQKMEVVGQLAGGVAHDFNNILTAMMLNLQVLELENSLPAEVRPPIEELKTMTRRAAKLTEQLLLFARRRVMQTQAVEFNAATASVLKMLQRVLGEHIAVNLRLGPAPLWINADTGLLDQVVMNLCVNARDAMPAGGTLTIETTRVEFDATTAPSLSRPQARPGRFACLRVSDTGCGMPAEVLAHLFEPFFTTKEVGKGTGLGLATVHGIVHQHQGWLEVESTVGKGSTFLVYLPRSARGPGVVEASSRAEVGGGNETILLVEDEPAVRAVTSTMLRRLGYRVIEAADGPAALQKWADHSREIDLLLSDMVMPKGLTGLELADMFRRSKPALGIVIISGYADEILKGAALQTAGVLLVAKPFEFSALAAAIRQSLGSRAPDNRIA